MVSTSPHYDSDHHNTHSLCKLTLYTFAAVKPQAVLDCASSSSCSDGVMESYSCCVAVPSSRASIVLCHHQALLLPALMCFRSTLLSQSEAMRSPFTKDLDCLLQYLTTLSWFPLCEVEPILMKKLKSCLSVSTEWILPPPPPPPPLSSPFPSLI